MNLKYLCGRQDHTGSIFAVGIDVPVWHSAASFAARFIHQVFGCLDDHMRHFHLSHSHSTRYRLSAQQVNWLLRKRFAEDGNDRVRQLRGSR